MLLELKPFSLASLNDLLSVSRVAAIIYVVFADMAFRG